MNLMNIKLRKQREMTKITEANRGLLKLKTDLTAESFRVLNYFPGFKKWDGRDFLFRPSGATCDFMEENFPDAEWDEVAEAHRVSNAKTKRIAAENREALKSELFDDSGYEYERPPMVHQGKAFAVSRDRELFAYFMEQGTGKTKVTIDVATWLFEKGEIDTLLVVAWPNGIHRQWVESELDSDLPSRIKYRAAFWNSQIINKAQESKMNNTLSTPEGELAIISFNVEAFDSVRARSLIEDFLTERKCLFVIDQSACIKTWSIKNSSRTKFLIGMSKLAKYKRILDGDPATEGAIELFAQFYFLDPNIIGCDTLTNFKRSYCQLGRFNNVEGYINLPELLNKIEPYVFRARAAEVLDLPERRYRRWNFDLTKPERRIWDELKKQDLALFKEDSNEDDELEVMETDLALVKHMRLQQIASGYFKSGAGELRAINGDDKSSRLKALESLLKHIDGDKCLIFTRFRADIADIEKLCGGTAVGYHGAISNDDRAANKHRFMNDDSITEFVGQPRAAGIGHTLTAAKHVIFYSNEPSLRFRTECEKRAHRKGLESTLDKDAGDKLQIWDLIAMQTTDTKGLSALRAKRDLANIIMGDPESFFLIEESD